MRNPETTERDAILRNAEANHGGARITGATHVACWPDGTPLTQVEKGLVWGWEGGMSMSDKTSKTKDDDAWFRVCVNGAALAMGRGPYDRVKAEAAHYAMMYAGEGEVKVRVQRVGKRKVR